MRGIYLILFLHTLWLGEWTLKFAPEILPPQFGQSTTLLGPFGDSAQFRDLLAQFLVVGGQLVPFWFREILHGDEDDIGVGILAYAEVQAEFRKRLFFLSGGDQEDDCDALRYVIHLFDFSWRQRQNKTFSFLSLSVSLCLCLSLSLSLSLSLHIVFRHKNYQLMSGISL